MNSTLSLAERDRRWSALQAAMRIDRLDALVVGMTDFRGQKGGFRYLSDERPFHRFGYAIMLAGQEPALVMHPMMAHAPRGAWIKDVRFPEHAGTEMARMIQAAGGTRVGLVSPDQVLRISDYKALAAAPGIELVDADPMFEAVRGPKSAEEIGGLEEAAAIADRCFAQLLEIARPGMKEREVSGKLSDTAISAGADELLYLTMSGDTTDEGVRAAIRAPGDHELDPGKPFVFSIELSGPQGFWVELARVIAFAGADPGVKETSDLLTASVTAGRAALKPGVSGSVIQAALETPFDPRLHAVIGSSGHAIGHDVIEMPMIDRKAGIPIAETMALAVHPMFNWRDRVMSGYIADTYIVEPQGGRVLSTWPMGLYDARR
jgi:Xaa-Pro aminopeptidase